MFEIQTVDIRGVPTKVFVNAPPSLRAIWEMSAAFADNVYLVYEDERITFTEAWAQVGAMGALLVDRYGVQKGDRVGIAMRAADGSFQAAALLRQLIFPIGSGIIAPRSDSAVRSRKNATVHD